MGGFGNRQRSLAIMKDPAAGPIAVLVLALLLLLKWSLISSIIEKQALSVLLLTPLLGRLAILMLMSTSDYIRTGGLAEKLIANLPQGGVNITIFLWLLITVFFLGILALVAVSLMVFIIRRLANKRLGGVTGDVYGATVELVEVSILMSVLI